MDFQEVYIGQAASHTLTNSEIYQLCVMAMAYHDFESYADQLEAKLNGGKL